MENGSDIEKMQQLLGEEGVKVDEKELAKAERQAEKDIKKTEGKFLRENDVIPRE